MSTYFVDVSIKWSSWVLVYDMKETCDLKSKGTTTMYSKEETKEVTSCQVSFIVYSILFHTFTCTSFASSCEFFICPSIPTFLYKQVLFILPLNLFPFLLFVSGPDVTFSRFIIHSFVCFCFHSLLFVLCILLWNAIYIKRKILVQVIEDKLFSRSPLNTFHSTHIACFHFYVYKTNHVFNLTSISWTCCLNNINIWNVLLRKQ